MIVLALDTQHQIKLNSSSIFFLENVGTNLQNWIFKWDILFRTFQEEQVKTEGKQHLSKSLPPHTSHLTPVVLN